MDRITYMEAFVRVAESQSFAEAARKWGISKAAVSRYVARLEEQLGIALFQRTTRSVALTEAGHAHYENCIQILSLLSQSEDQLRANHVSVAGRLRIAAPQGLLSMKGRSVLAPFLDRFPNVELEVDVSNELTDLVDARIDVAIRITVPEDSSLIARKLAPVPMVLVASRTYVDVRGLPPRPESLSGHACLSDRDSRADQQWPFRIDERRFVVSVSGPVRTNDPFIVRDLAREGHGIAMLPRVLADADLTAGRLEEILPGTLDATRNVYAITSQRRHLPKRAHVFIEHLRETLPATLVNKPARE